MVWQLGRRNIPTKVEQQGYTASKIANSYNIYNLMLLPNWTEAVLENCFSNIDSM
jgi:hypothetical protein